MAIQGFERKMPKHITQEQKLANKRSAKKPKPAEKKQKAAIPSNIK